MKDSPVIMDVYRDYVDTVNVFFPLLVKLSDGLTISMHVEINYIDSASRDQETWSGIVAFRYDANEQTFTAKLFKGSRQIAGS